MAQVSYGDTVKVHYTGKLEDGTVFDTSRNRDPLQFTLGSGQILPGFEQTLIGMTPGETKTAKIPADQAYGPYREDMVQQVDRKNFPEHLEPQIGQQLEARRGDGQPLIVTVTEVSETSVTVDANHPLAGKDLIFDIQLLEIV